MNLTETIKLRLDKEMKDALEARALREGRSLGSLVRVLLAQALKENTNG